MKLILQFNCFSSQYRLIGLTGVIQTSCSSTHALIFHEGIHWSYFVNPGVLLVLYWILAVNTNMWMHFTEVTAHTTFYVNPRFYKTFQHGHGIIFPILYFWHFVEFCLKRLAHCVTE